MMIIMLTACETKSQGETVTAVSPKEQESTTVNKQTEYVTQETEFYRNNMKISAELFIPENDEPTPLVILSHGFGGNGASLAGYAQNFAENGIAACTFDFIGGGMNIKSDGKTTEMSVLTEATDLEVILNGLRTDPRFDPDKIFLFGESQGGFVSTYVAGNHSEDVAGLIALYPAYMISDDTRKRVPDPDNIPETMEIMGIPLGSIYNRDAMSVDIYDQMKLYGKKVLILHGTNDSIAPISYSEHAVETFPNAELIRFDGAKHGFGGSDSIKAAKLSLEFVESLL
jgi:hypothetical protein